MEKLKNITLGKWCALYLVIAVVVQMLFIVLKWAGAITWSWHTVLIPLIVTATIIGLLAVFVGFAIMTVNAEERENQLEE